MSRIRENPQEERYWFSRGQFQRKLTFHLFFTFNLVNSALVSVSFEHASYWSVGISFFIIIFRILDIKLLRLFKKVIIYLLLVSIICSNLSSNWFITAKKKKKKKKHLKTSWVKKEFNHVRYTNNQYFIDTSQNFSTSSGQLLLLVPSPFHSLPIDEFILRKQG